MWERETAFILLQDKYLLAFSKERERGGNENTDLMEPKRKKSLLSFYICPSLETYLIQMQDPVMENGKNKSFVYVSMKNTYTCSKQ